MERQIDEVNPTMRELAQWAYETAKDKGWHTPPRSFGESIALMHSELSEALEEHRKGHKTDHVWTSSEHKPEGQLVELADCMIRILDYVQSQGVMDQFVTCFIKKMRYNDTRSYRHGGKKL